MSQRDALLKKLSVACFAAWELQIYLDTHPNDTRAQTRYNQYKATAKQLTEEYEDKYGPLTAGDSYGDSSWQWINSPWPWECGEVNG